MPALLLLLGGIPGCPLPAAQHLQLAQGQAELRARGAAPSAEREERQGVTWRWPSPVAPLQRPPATGMAMGACGGSRAPGAWGCCLGVPALGPGPGLGKQGSRGLRVLLGLGDDQGVAEEEEVPLPRRTALAQPHALAEQRLG